MASSITSFNAFLKDNYDTEVPTRLVAREDPFLDKLMANMVKSVGRQWVVPLEERVPQGLGGTLAKAQAAATQTSGGNVGGVDWTIAPGDYLGSVNIGDKIIDLTSSDVGAFFADKKEEIDQVLGTFGRVMASYLLRDSGHSLGSFTISNGVGTLVNPSDVVNFEVGQILVVSANDGTSTGHTLIGSSGAGYVISVDYSAGTFTVSDSSGGTAATPTNWSGTMYAFRDGDFGGTSSPNRIVLGYGAWVPVAAPGATPFEGVIRNTGNILARGGFRLVAGDVAGLGIEDRCKLGVTRMMSRGYGPPTDLFLHTEKWQALANALESRGVRDFTEERKAGYFGFPAIKLATPRGLIPVWSTPYMPIDACYAPNFETMRLATPTGRAGFPKFIQADGLMMLRSPTTNDYEVRIAAYPAFCIKGPGKCGRWPV